MSWLMSKKRQCLIFIAISMSAILVDGGFPDNLLEKTVYLKHNMVFAGQPPKVSSDEIFFMESPEKCADGYWGKVIGRGAPVKIIAAADECDFCRLTMISGLHGGHDVILDKLDVLLTRSEKGDFWPAFENAFSFDEMEERYAEQCDAKNKAELIDALGYPIYRCREKDSTMFYYNLGFLGHRVNGYHDIWFEIKGGRVIRNFGNI